MRESAREREVVDLEYEAYPGMAEQEIARIARAALADHGCLRAAIAHRTGVVARRRGLRRHRDLLGAPRAGVRRLQAGDRHAQADGADLEEGALPDGEVWIGQGVVTGPSRAARYGGSVSTNTPEPLFPEPRTAPDPGFDERPIHPQGSLRYWARRIGGPIVAAVVFGFQWVLKLKFLIFAVAKFGFVTTALTMVVSVGAYTLLWGWRFAALFVLLIFVHELGHALWLKREGIPSGAPVFIPFLGALISMRGRPRDAYVEAKVGLAGPVLGTIGSAVVLAIGECTNSDLLRAAAHHRVPAQPLQPAADRAARRRPRHGGHPPGALDRRHRSASAAC